KSCGLLPRRICPLFCVLCFGGHVPFPNLTAGDRSAASRPRGRCEPKSMGAGLGVCSAASLPRRLAGSSCADLLAPSCALLRTIGARLGLMVLGLDQEPAGDPGPVDRFGAGFVCGYAAQPAAMVALFLVSLSRRSACSACDLARGDRSPV